MSLLSFVYAQPNDVILFWPALVTELMTLCICRGIATADEELSCQKVCLSTLHAVVDYFFCCFNVWCQTLQSPCCDLSCTVED